MIVDVAFLPGNVGPLEGRVCLVVDLLRASSSLIAMLDAGAHDVLLASSPSAALAAAEAAGRERFWLCGEQEGEPPDGFDHGNSPAELSCAPLKTRRAIYCTSNGTRALTLLSAAPLVLVGALANAQAVVRLALEAADGLAGRVSVVCSGDDGGLAISLEDVYCAGFLIQLFSETPLRRCQPEDRGALAPNVLALDESALVARAHFRAYSQTGSPSETDVARVYQDSRNGRYQRSRGRVEDLRFCAQVNASVCVPRLARTADGLVVVRS